MPRAPYPGATTAEEILANVSYAMKVTQLYKRGLDVLLDPNGLKITRLLEVESDPIERDSYVNMDMDYYMIDVATAAGRPIATILLYRKSGLFVGFVDRRDGKADRLPTLAGVARGLQARYGDVSPRFVFRHYNFTNVDLLAPVIEAQTTRGRVMVTVDLDVYEEVGFDRDPPGLTADDLRARRMKQVESGPAMLGKGGIYRFRRADKIKIDSR